VSEAELGERAATCLYCGTTGKIRVEWRPELRARPLGSHSLSGNQRTVEDEGYGG
jgi:hypothetical protein